MFGGGSRGNFPLYVLTGTTVYGLFTSGTSGCLGALSGNKGFLIKTQLKKSIYVLERVLLAFRNFLYSMIVYAFMLALYRIAPAKEWLYVIPDIFLLLMMCYGIGKLLAVINVSFADITYFYKIFTLMLMYGSGVFYRIERMPSYVQAVMVFNPVYTAITIARTAILDKTGSPPVMWLVMTVYAVGCYAVGSWVFEREADNVVAKL
jgi:ABC-type polysaccharide/polyol phosphate export permease